MNKCSSNCNNINNPYLKICVLDVIKDFNVKVFNLMSRTNETKFIKWHEKCKCKCRLDAIICNNEQRWVENKCRCECKKLIDKGICDKGFIWNPSNCECDKICDFSEYLDYENCKCSKKLVDILVYIVLMIVVLTIFTGITIYFVYYNWFLIKNNVSCIKFNTHKETKI